MNRLVRSLITGSIVGAAVGVSMVVLQKRANHNSSKPMMKGRVPKMTRASEQSRGAVRMVRDNTMRWTSAIKNNTEALSKRLSRRLT